MDNKIVAAIQMVSGHSLEDNLHTVKRMCREASQQGAHLLVLPENFALLDGRSVVQLGVDEAKSGQIQKIISNLAKELGVWIVAGSIPLASKKDAKSCKVYSACLVFDDTGEIHARYNKIHLFDVDVGDAAGTYRESDRFLPGSNVVVVDTPVGKVGLAICYDLRFSELFLALRKKGAEVIVVPSAFTYKTGEAHWELLLRARAIECQCFVVGVNQGGRHSETRETWGHSMVIDPWGNIIDSLALGEGVASGSIDLLLIDKIRSSMPIESHRRFSLGQLGGEGIDKANKESM